MNVGIFRKVLGLGIIVLFVGASFIPLTVGIIEKKAAFTDLNSRGYTQDLIDVENGWYNLSAYDNYAPSGLPDFDQRQQEDYWVNISGNLYASFCTGATYANILWWLDSKYSNTTGTPGDGEDNFSLVQNYQSGTINPGPYHDDHNYNNVNDPETPFGEGLFKPTSGELIDRIGWYLHRDQLRKIPGSGRPSIMGGIKGIILYQLFLWLWTKDLGLNNFLKIEPIFKPSFSEIVGYLQNNTPVILGLFKYNTVRTRKFFPEIPTILPKIIPFDWGHAVSVAGINPEERKIAISDPMYDKDNPLPHPEEEYYTLHNNASIVSHDVYEIKPTPSGTRASNWGLWYIPNYCNQIDKAVVVGAVIISEQYNPKEISLKNFF